MDASRPSDDYEAQDAVRTLQRADEIRRDPKLHGAAKKHARKQLRSLKKIAGHPARRR